MIRSHSWNHFATIGKKRNHDSRLAIVVSGERSLTTGGSPAVPLTIEIGRRRRKHYGD